MATTEFHQFPKLPVELRLKIWRLAPDQRVAEAEWCIQTSTWFVPIESHQPVHSLQLVNRESQEEYLKHWLRFLPYRPSTSRPLSTAVEAGPYVIDNTCHKFSYFNSAIDTLYIGAGDPVNHDPQCILGHEQLKQLAWHSSLAGVSIVAVNERDAQENAIFEDFFIMYFSTMKTLITVHGDINYDHVKADYPGIITLRILPHAPVVPPDYARPRTMPLLLDFQGGDEDNSAEGEDLQGEEPEEQSAESELGVPNRSEPEDDGGETTNDSEDINVDGPGTDRVPLYKCDARIRRGGVEWDGMGYLSPDEE